MSIRAKELIEWLNKQGENAAIGIDYGGLFNMRDNDEIIDVEGGEYGYGDKDFVEEDQILPSPVNAGKQVLARMFIGANNSTHACEQAKIERIVGKWRLSEGLTIYPTVGMWQGKKEDSVCIEKSLPDNQQDRKAWESMAVELRYKLDQDCILVQFIPVEYKLI